MTRFLSHALQAPEPFFRLGLRRLELANGNPSADIRFSSEVTQATRQKLLELGLDPRDTTPRELYRALQERLRVDDARLTRALRTQAATHISAEANVVDGMVHVLRGLPDSKRCFALKASRLKAILKQAPPKKAMKQLGYRSLDSFLKHESPALALTAGWLVEGQSWQKRLLDQYAKLQPADFENRKVQLLQPSSPRWHKLAHEVVAARRHNLVCLKELGVLVFLPLDAKAPEGSTTVSLGLALHNLNDIRASSTFLKLCQVRPDFGAIVRNLVTDEARLSSQLLDQPVPWHLIQQYYARLTHHFREALFEPHLQLEDMAWHPIESTLAQIDPKLAFWDGSHYLGILEGGRAVSMNIIDVALNYCNRMPFENRVVQQFQQSLWHELLLRYFNHHSVERTVLNELQPELAREKVLA